jgi:hypothetical protein
MENPTSPLRLLLELDHVEGLGYGAFGMKLLAVLAVWLLVLAIIQGNWRRFVSDLVDLRGHWADLRAGLSICRRAFRPIGALLACYFLAWAAWCLCSRWNEQSYAALLEDWLTLFDGSALAFSAAFGLRPASSALLPVLAASMVAGAALLAWLVVVAGRCVGWAHFIVSLRLLPDSLLVLLFLHRASVAVADKSFLPCCVGVIELPALVVAMVLADAIVLKWVAIELAEARRMQGRSWFELCQEASTCLWPALLLCLLGGGYRNIALFAHIQVLTNVPGALRVLQQLAEVNWLLGPVLLAGPAVLGAARPAQVTTFLRQWVLLCRHAGGRIAAWTLYATLAQWLVSVPCYWLFASMEPLPWSIFAMFSYASYANLIVTLCLLAVLTDHACRHLADTREQVELLEPAPVL